MVCHCIFYHHAVNKHKQDLPTYPSTTSLTNPTLPTFISSAEAKSYLVRLLLSRQARS